MLHDPHPAPTNPTNTTGTTDTATAVEVWWRENAGRVRAYLCHRVDPATAEDLLQEVFVIAIRRAGDVPEPPIGWLFNTARRVLANHRRGGLRHRGMLGRLMAAQAVAPPDPQADAGDRSDHAALEALFAGLSTADREVLTLTAWYGLTAAEAAQALGITTNAYGVRLHRARARLQQAHAGDDDQPAGAIR